MFLHDSTLKKVILWRCMNMIKYNIIKNNKNYLTIDNVKNDCKNVKL